MNRRNAIVLGVLIVIAVAYFANQSNEPDSGGTLPPANVSDTTVDLVYKLTGSARAASITYTDGSGNIQQQTRVGVPLVSEAGPDGISFTVHRGDFVQFRRAEPGRNRLAQMRHWDRSAPAQQLPSPVFDTVGVDKVEDF